MKRWAAGTALLFLVSALGFSAQRGGERSRVFTDVRSAANRSSDPVINEIIKLEQTAVRDIEDRRADDLDTLADEDFVYASPWGELFPKSRWLTSVETGSFGHNLLRDTPYRNSAPRRTVDYRLRFNVRQYGDTAIAMGVQTVNVPLNSGASETIPFFFTRVYTRQGRDWRLSYMHLARRGLKGMGEVDPFTRRGTDFDYDDEPARVRERVRGTVQDRYREDEEDLR